MMTLRIALSGEASARDYPIVIGDRVLWESRCFLVEACPSRRVVVVSDDRVWGLHGGVLATLLTQWGFVFEPVIVPEGEQSKSLTCLAFLYNAFCGFRLRRDDTVIAFGGGVVGDLAGFGAATFLRGVPFVQIPTTLMAQVDSGVGGKVAVNLPQGKNLAGCFYQPRLVVADVSLLETLDKRDWDSGMAEAVKYAALGDDGLGEIFREPVAESDLTRIVWLCCAAKGRFVMEDELDQGVRALLNFGHTFAHALETFYGYGTYRHGEAVARGMLIASEVGSRLGVSVPGTGAALKGMLDNAGIEGRLTENVDEGVLDFLPLIQADKKNPGGVEAVDEVALVLLRELGDAYVHKIRYEDLVEVFANSRSGLVVDRCLT
ncbi:MAG: 3-dehydroquinate synthase [Peptococcaceae bacterium]|nr:3-dehydroquinate synthase [Peptococcaceae bacterium]